MQLECFCFGSFWIFLAPPSFHQNTLATLFTFVLSHLTPQSVSCGSRCAPLLYAFTAYFGEVCKTTSQWTMGSWGSVACA
jgi:hypothetical protein